MAKRGRPFRIQAEHHLELRAIVESNPMSTLGEIQSKLERRAGVHAHFQTLQRTLRELGFLRQAGGAVQVEATGKTEPRYGCTEDHRRLAPEQTYPSCLTDAERALVEDLFSNECGRGLPPQYPRRLLVDACCYVVRTGCSWRVLPKGFPP